jgi:Flp pilus assembly protein TadD
MRILTAAGSIVPSRFPLRSVLSAALLIGAAQTSAFAHDKAPQDKTALGDTRPELLKVSPAMAVELGEAAVAKAPQDAVLRAELGHAYLRAGRFESAASALGDAVALGDGSGRTVLILALAQIACGQNRAALLTLDHGTGIAPADLGLALALAGDTGRGVATLTDAVRDGSPSTNVRQNLAYAYALDGRWADATLTAGFDLPPDQVTARVQQWAQSMQAGGERVRIARLLDVPLIVDAGMPSGLALNAARPALAIVPAAVLASVQPEVVPLPALQPIATAPVPAPQLAEVMPMPIQPVVAAVNPVAIAVADIAAPVTHVIAAPPWQDVVQQLAVQSHGTNPRSNHYVQLAAYHNQRDAERGRLILAKRHSLLRGHGLLITEARLHGRSYWRVVMAGFDGATASSTCANLKRQGAACFAYAVRPEREGQALALATAPVATRSADRRR